MIREILTNPKEHDKDSFIYLVHSFMDWNGDGISQYELREKLKRINDSRQFYRASLIAHLNEDSVKNKVGYHGKITQDGTFGNIGVILDPVNEGAIYIAWNSDLGSPPNKAELKEFALKHMGKIKSPLQLLTKTVGPKDIKYNELVLQGCKNTEVQGVFFRGNNIETRYKAKMLADIACETSQRDLPIIEIPLPPYESINNPEDQELESMLIHSEMLGAQLEFTNPNYQNDKFPTFKTFENHTQS